MAIDYEKTPLAVLKEILMHWEKENSYNFRVPLPRDKEQIQEQISLVKQAIEKHKVDMC